MFIVGSRLPSQWLGVPGECRRPRRLEEGNPLDRTIYFILILLAIGILISRSFKWGDFFARNLFLMAFLVFCSGERLLVRLPLRLLQAVVSGPRQLPRDSRRSLRSSSARSCPYVASTSLLPADPAFAFCSIKYYPDIGRQYTIHGQVLAMYVGSYDEQEHARRRVPAQRNLLFLGYGDALVRS